MGQVLFYLASGQKIMRTQARPEAPGAKLVLPEGFVWLTAVCRRAGSFVLNADADIHDGAWGPDGLGATDIGGSEPTGTRRAAPY